MNKIHTGLAPFGNLDIEKRAIFYSRLLPLLEFGRERERLDLAPS